MIASALRTLSRLGTLSCLAGLGALLTLAQPAGAADFTIDNMRFDFGAVLVTAPRIAVKGSPLDREAFLSLVNTGSGENAVARMGRLTAAEISAPELVITWQIGPQRQVTTYRGLRFSDIREGRIARGEAASGVISVTSTDGKTPGATPGSSPGGAVGRAFGDVAAAPGAMSGSILKTSFEGLDLGHMARVLTERAAPGKDEPTQPLFTRFDQDGYTLDMGQAGKVSIGKSSARGLAAKVGTEPLGESLSRFVTLSEAAEKAARAPGAKPRDPADPAVAEADKRVMLAMLEITDTLDFGSGEIRDMAMRVVTPPTPGEKPVAIDLAMARIGYGEDTPAKSGFAMEGLTFAGGGAAGRLDSLSYAGFSFGPVMKELRELLAKPDADLDALDYRKLIPTLGTVRIAGLSVDAPQETKPGQKPKPPIRIGLGLFEMKAGEQLNGVPTKLGLTLDNLTIPVTADTEQMQDLLAMGYQALDLSARLDMAWDAGRSELAISALSLGAANMANFQASGTLGNVTQDLFSGDAALAQVAALGATVRNLQAKLQNFGLLEKIIDNQARKTKRKPADVRREFSMMANLGLAGILGPSDAAKTLTAAVSRFAAKPGTLSVEASAKSASGLGLADVIAIGDPTEIFDKIDLKANAE